MSTPLPTFCLNCGYSLRGLQNHKCPECGRDFDPANLKTMSVGAPLRNWQRWLLRPVGMLTILPAIASAAMMGYISWSPTKLPIPKQILKHEYDTLISHPKLTGLTGVEKIYAVAVLLFSISISFFLLKLLSRVLVPRDGRRASIPLSRYRWRYYFLLIVLMVTPYLVGFGWPCRTGRIFVEQNKVTPFISSNGGPVAPVPVWLSSEHTLALGYSLIHLYLPNDRRVAMQLLVEWDNQVAIPYIIEAAKVESDPALLIEELHVIAIARDSNALKLFDRFLSHKDSKVRAAAIDGIGLLRKPSFSVQVFPETNFSFHGAPMKIDSPTQISLESIYLPLDGWYDGFRRNFDLVDQNENHVASLYQQKFLTMMVNGSSSEEQEAAARALVNWPPDKYQLRLAEWGVWLNSRGQYALAQCILDEIPPFVHQAGNPGHSFDCYIERYEGDVTKPIIHLTSNMPLAVDIAVQLNKGRPWYAYPKPNDFDINLGRGQDAEDKPLGKFQYGEKPPFRFDNTRLKILDDCWEGYPWISPHHRLHRSNGNWHGSDASIMSLGMRWQSVIVNPNPPKNMKLATVPADEKYQWWEKLRKVPSSWVTNRGETERFLYYDGPTASKLPVDVKLVDARHLQFYPQDETQGKEKNQPGLHEGIYIHVANGVASAQHISLETDDANPELANPLPFQGEAAVAAKILEMLTRYGMTKEEAQGVIDAWAPQWFHAPGRRFLLRMSPKEYDTLCPLTIRPKPTTTVRLGLVMTEFDGADKVLSAQP